MVKSGSIPSAQPSLVGTGALSTTMADVCGEISESVLAKLAALCTAYTNNKEVKGKSLCRYVCTLQERTIVRIHRNLRTRTIFIIAEAWYMNTSTFAMG